MRDATILKVIFPSQKSATDYLVKAKGYLKRNPQHSRVFIRKSLSLEERQKDQEARRLRYEEHQKHRSGNLDGNTTPPGDFPQLGRPQL